MPLLRRGRDEATLPRTQGRAASMNAPDGMERFIERVREHRHTRLITKVVLPIVTLLLLPLIGVQWNGMRDDIRDVKVRQEIGRAHV